MKKKNKAVMLFAAAVLSTVLIGMVGFLVMHFVRMGQEERLMEEQFSRELKESQKTIDKLKEQESELDSELAKARLTTTPSPEDASKEMELLASILDCQPGEVLNAGQLYLDNSGIYFTAQEIQEGDDVYLRISKALNLNTEEIRLNELRYLRMPYYRLDGEILVGEMVVQKSIAQSVLDGCLELFQKKYAVSSMNLEDHCWVKETDWESVKTRLGFQK